MIHIKSIRVVVSHEQCLLRNALIERIEQDPDIRVCAVASSIEETLELVERHRPHVLAINLSLGSGFGAWPLRKLKRQHPKLAVVALSCSSEYENIQVSQALRAGVDGYVSAVDSLEDLVEAIHVTREGRSFMSLRTECHHRQSAAEEKAIACLSRREAEAYFLVGCGYVPKRIADKMGITWNTLESFLERIRTKMNFAKHADLQYSATSFMLAAARRGIDGDDDRVIEELLSARC